MTKDKNQDELPRIPILSSIEAVQRAAARLPRQPLPTEFWRAVFLDEEVDYSIPYDKRPPPVDLLPRPAGFKDRGKRYICSFKVTETNKDENRRRWREIVLEYGEGTYNWYDTIDEAGEKPIALFGWWKVMFICEEDVEAIRLNLGEEPLTDAQVAELEATFMADVLKGDAGKAETLACEHARRGQWVDARRVAVAGMKADDYDDGIWKNYDEDKRPQRNVDRRLLAMHNRAARHVTKGDASLHSTVDVGEADPKRECEKCEKHGALGAEYGFGGIFLCHGCRRLPKDQWPKPKPIMPFFTNTSTFSKVDGKSDEKRVET